MASAARSRPSAATSRQSSRPTILPQYQPLNHDLNHTAQHALLSLPTTHSLNDLKRRLQSAVNHLTEVTGDLNDQCQIRKANHEKQQARKAARTRELVSSQDGAEVDDDSDQQMEDIWRRTDEWTSKMEEKTRKVIDVQARVIDGENALKELNINITQGRTATQSTLGASQLQSRSQRQQRSRRGQQPTSDDEENDADDSQAENNNEETFTGPSPLTTFKTKISASELAYASLSLKDRYASHNDYIGFRKIVHDARHPNDDTPLPHSSTWFPSSSSSEPSGLQNARKSRSASTTAAADPQHSDSDADIQIAREKRSIRCPLTLLPMHDPLTSTLCPHSFEKSAILSMLDASTVKANVVPGVRGSGEKAMKCPECEVQLTASNLRQDPILVRKIRRIEEQERRERERDEDEEDEDEDVRGPARRSVEDVTSSPAQSRVQVKAEAVKKERMSGVQRTQASREPSMVPATQIVDLGDDEEEEVEHGQ
ncbi:MAG: hypothetical protein LQ343_004805 [Gyalolechia ehrenbergii]|nr:MAG: hypothetical protein LQ343_004805 [Gyalolechia ehrenbergii]